MKEHYTKQNWKVNLKRSLLCGVLALGFCLSSTGDGFAQSNETEQLMGRIHQLENQVQTLSRSVYRGDATAVGSVPVQATNSNPNLMASFEVRLSQMEGQMQRFTGIIEQQRHDIRILRDQLSRAMSDYEQRFSALESGRVQYPVSSGVTYGQVEMTRPSVSAKEYNPTSQNASVKPVFKEDLGTVKSLGTLTQPSQTMQFDLKKRDAVHQGSPSKITIPEALYEKGFTLVREAKHVEAGKAFREFLSKYPKHVLASNAQYWLAETYYARGEYTESAKLFAKGYQDFPKSPKSPDNLLKLSLSLEKLDQKEDACLSLMQLEQEFSGEVGPVMRRAAQEIKRIGCK